jgi:glycosyltransferase involved in cell wall biosynthesis
VYNRRVFRQLRVAVVVPAFNEAPQIDATLAGMPAWLDAVIVVDDASSDATAARARASCAHADVLSHVANRGVGAAIATGYRRALAVGADVAVVMAGDGQMDPSDLPRLLAPIADGLADYVKGNRFLVSTVWREMPASRIVGNLLLSAATRVTSGYRHVFDSQCGYTAIQRRTLTALDLDALWARYGYPNDLLSRLHVVGARVVDVPVRAIYGARWKSGIDLRTVLHPLPYVLLRSWRDRVIAERQRAANGA